MHSVQNSQFEIASVCSAIVAEIALVVIGWQVVCFIFLHANNKGFFLLLLDGGKQHELFQNSRFSSATFGNRNGETFYI
jgi:hypothetical protein